MVSRRWIRAAVWAVSGAALPVGAVRAQSAPVSVAPARSEETSFDAAALVTQDLSALDRQLTRAPDSSQRTDGSLEKQREEAAQRLLSRDSPASHQYLLAALQTTTLSREVKAAVARAVADSPRPDPSFIPALIPLIGTDRALSDAAARALARFGDSSLARERLIAYAMDAHQPAALRIGVVRALGAMISRDVANALVSLVTDPKQGAAIQSAAADALGELTGEAIVKHDPAFWKQWQTANANKPDVVWRADILAANDARRAFGEQVQEKFANELKQILMEQYQRADPATKFALVMRLLDSAEPQTRALGVQTVMDAHDNARPYPAEAPKKLESLVGDSDPGVRLITAQAIQSLNDTDALQALLTQIPQETNIDVKVAQIGALMPMMRLAAVPELRQLLTDPSMRVAIAAVEALRKTAPLLTQNPALAQDVAGAVWNIGAQRKNEPDGIDFQAAAIELVGTLGDRAQARDLLALLNVNNDARIRIAALRALASLQDHGTSFQIAQWLNIEPDPAVRIEAIHALGATSNFEGASDTLFKFESPNTEPDKAVREQATLEFETLLPTRPTATNVAVLNRWVSDLQNDPIRRLPVLRALNDLLQQQSDWEDLALSRQNTGEVYLSQQVNDPARAAIQFKEALDYWQKRKIASEVTVQLSQQLMQAYLAAREYDKAADFAGKQIAMDPTMQSVLGPIIRDAAERLMKEGLNNKDPAKLADAVNLIDSALKVQPPLSGPNLADLRDFRQQIQQAAPNLLPKK